MGMTHKYVMLDPQLNQLYPVSLCPAADLWETFSFLKGGEACLRVAASAKAGERAGVRGSISYPPLPQSFPVKGEEANTCNFHYLRVTNLP